MKHPWFHRFRKNRKEEAGQIPAEETTVTADAEPEAEEQANNRPQKSLSRPDVFPKQKRKKRIRR